MHQTMKPAMKECIEACEHCHHICLSMAMMHCLQRGGAHVEPSHFRLMRDCAEICATSANFMLSGSQFHGDVCEACAEVCEACAASCEKLGDMQSCVDACRRCAESCRAMAASA